MIYTNQKSKLTKKQRATRDALLKEQRAIKRSLKQLQSKTTLTSTPAYHRETPKVPSLPCTGAPCTKPIHGKVYTGSSMIGIGTLHKSNAVPIFSQDDAKEQARMRRG
jgi:hypothetical protein